MLDFEASLDVGAWNFFQRLDLMAHPLTVVEVLAASTCLSK
jgi:hypothetical protein